MSVGRGTGNCERRKMTEIDVRMASWEEPGKEEQQCGGSMVVRQIN